MREITEVEKRYLLTYCCDIADGYPTSMRERPYGCGLTVALNEFFRQLTRRGFKIVKE